MKWTLSDSTSAAEKLAKIPSINTSRRNSRRLLLAFLRYSARKRTISRGGKDRIAQMVAFTEKKSDFGGLNSHQARGLLSHLSKEELSVIQIQLAILSDRDGDRPIHIAVANGDLKLVQKLCHLMLKNNISLDIRNYLRQTPLHLAVMLGNFEIFQLLLNCGASPTVCDRNGNTVLHLCVKSHYEEAILYQLLTHTQVKTILNSMDYEGYSALHYAVFKNNTGAVKLLKFFGADMNKIDGKSGRTALIHAVLEHNVKMVELLLESGASPNKTDYSGRSAFDMAIQLANKPIIQLLEKWIPNNEESSPIEKHTTIHQCSQVKRTKNQNS